LSDIVDLNSVYFIPQATINTNQVKNQSNNFSSVLTAYNHPEIFRRLYENLNRRANYEIPYSGIFYDCRENPRFHWYYYLKGVLMHKWRTSDLRVWYHRLKRWHAKRHHNNNNADGEITEVRFVGLEPDKAKSMEF